MITKEAPEAMLQRFRARYAADGDAPRITPLVHWDQETPGTSRRSPSVSWLDRFFPRIVIGRPGPGQRQ